MAITTGSLIISWGDCSWLTQWFQNTQQGLGHNCSLLVSLHFNPLSAAEWASVCLISLFPNVLGMRICKINSAY